MKGQTHSDMASLLIEKDDHAGPLTHDLHIEGGNQSGAALQDSYSMKADDQLTEMDAIGNTPLETDNRCVPQAVNGVEDMVEADVQTRQQEVEPGHESQQITQSSEQPYGSPPQTMQTPQDSEKPEGTISQAHQSAEQPMEPPPKPTYRDMGTMTSDFEELAGMVFVAGSNNQSPIAQLSTPADKSNGLGEAKMNGLEEAKKSGLEEANPAVEEPVQKVSLYVEAVPQVDGLDEAGGGQQLVLGANEGPAASNGAMIVAQAGSEAQEQPVMSSPDIARKKGGLRCEVCKRVKKPGCGTEKAHPRCERRPHDTPTMEQLDIDHAMKLSNVGEDERISLWNPVSGARLSGMAAPMLRNLPTWLKRNPGWQPVEKGPDGTPARKRRKSSTVSQEQSSTMDQLLAAAVSESGEQVSPMTNPPQTPNPAATPASSGTSSQQQRSVTPNRPSNEPLTEEDLEASQRQKEQWAEARRIRKELGPRCEVCQIIKKAGCGTEDANPRCLRHPRRGEDGQVELAATAQAPAPKPVSRKPVFKYEGGRCEVCTTIKKGGCGTENAHRRCLKNPRGLQTSMSPLTGDGLDGQEGEPVPTLVEQQRVTLWHPEKKQKLCGMAAPMLKNLEHYLKIHPGWVPIQKIDEGVTAPSTAGFIEG